MAPPIAKLRKVARQLEIDDREFEQEPWAAAVWLMSFRNKVAHARPERVLSSKTMSNEAFRRNVLNFPQSKWELSISLSNARRAVKTVRSILHKFCDGTDPGELMGLLSDGWSTTSSPVHLDDVALDQRKSGVGSTQGHLRGRIRAALSQTPCCTWVSRFASSSATRRRAPNGPREGPRSPSLR